MTIDSNEKGDPLEVEGEILRMWEICIREHNENHTFTSTEMVRARIDKGGGRRAYDANQYEKEVIPKVLRLEYIIRRPDKSWILSEIGKGQCRILRKNGMT